MRLDSTICTDLDSSNKVDYGENRLLPSELHCRRAVTCARQGRATVSMLMRQYNTHP